MAEQEGVIKYTLQFSQQALEPLPDITSLNHWRAVLIKHGLVGQNPQRYDGYGFGNISQRVGQHAFLISGTQTGHIETLEAKHYALVTAFDKANNSITAQGLWKPSSEALSHGAIYQAHPGINAVFHVHSPDIWQNWQKLNCRTTAADIPYGTPAMADAMQELVDSPRGLLVMLGHEDGVIAYGRDCDEAGNILLDLMESLSS